jgi:preprotein translocase subunit SecF
MRIFSDAHYEFIARRKTAYFFSAAVIIIGIGAMVANALLIGSWQNYGVDFTGGALVQVQFSAPMTAGELRSAMGGEGAPTITRFGEDNEFTIRAPVSEDADVDAVRNSITDDLTEAFGAGSFEVVLT